MRQRLPKTVNVLDPSVLTEIAPETIPQHAWVALPQNIYPIILPEIELRPNLDLVLIDCPSRNLALMPNGLAYVGNALKKTSVSYQVIDLDIVAYHEFHIHRLYDMGGRITLPSGRVLPEDPWQAEHYDIWSSGSETTSIRGGRNEVLDFFRPLIDKAIAAIVAARPKILGLSIQQCNEAISREVVRGIKALYPEIVVLVGGFSCYNADIGRQAFPECDYMCIGEADLTVGPLVEALARGERPSDQPGVLSRFDSENYRYIPAPMAHNLDQIAFPQYEWADLSLYRNYNGYQLTPIIASRGCRWSRCTFCAERFYWRIRSPQNFVDELEWLVDRGCHLFMFNESDLNGMPDRVMEICDEIVRRGLHNKVKLTGQLRIHKKSTRQFFEKLRAANFVALRFGVDAFSANTLRLQKKGYTVDMISQNLKDCWEVGIFTEVNWVIGVPGETEADVEEGIQLILANRQYIGRLANINPLILVNGSVYWIDPAAHNIVFKEDKAALYAKHPRALPADSWYSIEPYIDAQVRKERFERIVVALYDAGFPVGAWAQRIIEDVKYARDPNRAGGKAFETSDTIEDSKPAASPPLFGEAGAPPRVLRKLETHDIIFYDGWYFAVPLALGDIDVRRSDAADIAGIIKRATEQEVISAVTDASRFANTRGQYDPQEEQRAAGTYMRAASVLGETDPGSVPDRPKIIYFDGQAIAVTWPEIQVSRRPVAAPPEQHAKLGWRDAIAAYVGTSLGRFLRVDRPPIQMKQTVAVGGEECSVVSVVTKDAVPEFICAIGRYNLVKFDGAIYGLPQGIPIDWNSGEVALLPGVVIAKTLRDTVRLIEAATEQISARLPETSASSSRATGPAGEASGDPKLLQSLEGYNVVSYEGWVYGIPQTAGPVDLTETDVMEMEGVIRDVSADVVENEILERVKLKQRVAA